MTCPTNYAPQEDVIQQDGRKPQKKYVERCFQVPTLKRQYITVMIFKSNVLNCETHMAMKRTPAMMTNVTRNLTSLPFWQHSWVSTILLAALTHSHTYCVLHMMYMFYVHVLHQMCI
jgi:hypothetical protein